MAIGRGGYNTPVLALAGRNQLQQGRGGYNKVAYGSVNNNRIAIQGRGGYNRTGGNGNGGDDSGRGGYN